MAHRRSRRQGWDAVLAQPRVQEALRLQREQQRRAPLAEPLRAASASPVATTAEPQGPAMNKTEARYAQRLEVARRAGEIADFRFAAITLCITSQLRRRRRYTPDFCVLRPDGSIELVEVKGSYVYEDARLKFEFAVEQWGEVFAFTWAQWARGEWSVQTHPRRRS